MICIFFQFLCSVLLVISTADAVLFPLACHFCHHTQYWTDEYLTWNQTDFGGLDRVMMFSHELWKPDVCLYEA